MLKHAVTVALCLCFAGAAAADSFERYYLASQYDGPQSRGFSIDIEGDRVDALTLLLTVARDTRAAAPSLRFDCDYQLRAVFGPAGGRLSLGGTVIVETPTAWQPASGPLLVAYRPAWSSSEGDWLCEVTSLTVTLQRSSDTVWRHGPADGLSAPLQLFAPPALLAPGALPPEAQGLLRGVFPPGLPFDPARAAERDRGLLLGLLASLLPFDPMAAPRPLQDVVLDIIAGPRATPIEAPAQPGDTLALEAILRFRHRDRAYWEPLVDAYGQCTYSDFPGRVKDEADLVADVAAEDAVLAQMPPPAEMDQYGGYRRAGWSEAGTGFFRVRERDGFWWLITPEGNPCFYLGVSVLPGHNWSVTPVTGRESLFAWLPPREAPWSSAWVRDRWERGEQADCVNLYQANLMRKYGAASWSDAAVGRLRRRLRAWGFGGGGKWDALYGVVTTPVLYVPTPKLVAHPDVFDPEVRAALRRDFAARIEPHRRDPYVLGWSYQNEGEALITRREIAAILASPTVSPSKRALLDYALDAVYSGSLGRLSAAWQLDVTSREALYMTAPEPPSADLEKLRLWYADRYFATIYATIKGIDPDHLVIAPWVLPGLWESEDDWRLLARHCDVVGYDRYSARYHDDDLARLQAAADKPTLCGEFSFPATYDGRRGFGRFPTVAVRDDEEAGLRYYDWIREASRDPYCVGLLWFQYVDQPVTGRGPGSGAATIYGENYAEGLVTGTDRPKWPLVCHVREANLQAVPWRLEAMGAR
jgi:hypothetical protein